MHPISKVLVGGNGKIWEQNVRLWPIYMVNISREDQKYLWRSIKHCKYQSQEWILTTCEGLVLSAWVEKVSLLLIEMRWIRSHTLWRPVAKLHNGTTDLRVEFISQVLTQIFKFQFQILDYNALTSKSQPNISISTKLISLPTHASEPRIIDWAQNLLYLIFISTIWHASSSGSAHCFVDFAFKMYRQQFSADLEGEVWSLS